MNRIVRVAILILTVAFAARLPLHITLAAEPSTTTELRAHTVYMPIASDGSVRDVAQAFTSDQVGLLRTGGGQILTIGPNSIPTYQNGTPATVTLSADIEATPSLAPPSWLRIISAPVNFGPDGFVFNFPLTVRLPVSGVTNVANLFFLRYHEGESWTRSLFAFDPANPTALESTVFTLGTMAVGEYDGVSAAATEAIYPPGGLYVPHAHCPISTGDCFYYLTIQNFVPKYSDEVSAGALTGQTLRLRANVTGESPLDTGWLLPQGTYTFCYSALEAPLTLTYLEKYINPNPQVVVIDQPYACSFTNTCKTTIYPSSPDGWIKATDDRPCGMGGNLAASDPATLGQTGEFQATLTWTNSSSHNADLDLHLYGPNNLHVSYSSKLSSDGSLQLDRDWQREEGDAVENIFQLKDSGGHSIPMPQGSYTVSVDHYSGDDAMPYQVRVIRNGSVQNFSNSLSNGGEHTILTFTVP